MTRFRSTPVQAEDQSGSNHVFYNNLRALRDRRKWTQDEAAAALDTSRNYYAKLENGSRRLNTTWIARAASAFGVNAGDIVRGQPPRDIVGQLEEGGFVRWSSGLPTTSTRDAYIVVHGNALGPLFETWLVGLQTDLLTPADIMHGEDYVVRVTSLRADALLCRVMRCAHDPAKFHLVRHSAVPICDTAIHTAYRVTGLIRS